MFTVIQVLFKAFDICLFLGVTEKESTVFLYLLLMRIQTGEKLLLYVFTASSFPELDFIIKKFDPTTQTLD